MTKRQKRALANAKWMEFLWKRGRATMADVERARRFCAQAFRASH